MWVIWYKNGWHTIRRTHFSYPKSFVWIRSVQVPQLRFHSFWALRFILCNILYNLYSIIVGMAVNMAPLPQKYLWQWSRDSSAPKIVLSMVNKREMPYIDLWHTTDLIINSYMVFSPKLTSVT